MLSAHFDLVEKYLAARGRIAASSGHPVIKGTAREAFVKEFLGCHLSERLAIGTGEIIDANSKAGESRNQHDVILYKPEYPRIEFGGGVTAYLAESVVATIEVKSVLDKQGFLDAMAAAANVKRLVRKTGVGTMTMGYVPPGILCYLVAYDGPQNMETVHGWLRSAEETGLVYPKIPEDRVQAHALQAPALDAVFVLERGLLHYGNFPVGLYNPKPNGITIESRFAGANTPRGNLCTLFLFLTQAAAGVALSPCDMRPYMTTFRAEKPFHAA